MSQISSTGSEDEPGSTTPGAPGTGEVIALVRWAVGSSSAALTLLAGSLCSTTAETPVDSSFSGARFVSPAGVSNNDGVVGAGAVGLCPLLPNTGLPPGAVLLSLSERGEIFAGWAG